MARARAGRWAAALAAAIVLGACASDSAGSGASSPTTAPIEPVRQEVLAETEAPPGAPDMTLSLVRYTIAAGTELDAHIHPGVQMAFIEAGRLTYTVIEGTATIWRAGGDAVEEVTGPARVELQRGDSVIELEDMVHYGANESDQPVVILATLLTETGEDLAISP